MHEIATRLRRERERRSWTQAYVAEKIGTTDANVSRWERGKTTPDMYYRQQLCTLYEKTAEQLGFYQEEVPVVAEDSHDKPKQEAVEQSIPQPTIADIGAPLPSSSIPTADERSTTSHNQSPLPPVRPSRRLVLKGLLGGAVGLGALSTIIFLNQHAHRSTLPYYADWSSETNGWVGSSDWRISHGELFNDGGRVIGAGQLHTPTITAPCQLDAIADYLVEVDIQILNYAGGFPGFGVFVRYRSDGQGYIIGPRTQNPKARLQTLSVAHVFDPYNSFQRTSYIPDKSWHNFRIIVKSSSLHIERDGTSLLAIEDSVSLSGGSVGFWSSEVTLALKNFSIHAL